MRSFILTCLVLISASAWSSETANLKKGVILKGYDPVSYFTQSGPSKGKKNFSATIGGVTYLFTSEANRSEFVASPEKYIPEYEGWCASAVAGGYKYDIDPKNYKITNGRLFVFYKGILGDARKDWLKDEPRQLRLADENWPTVKFLKK